METSLFSPYVRVVFRSCSLEGKDKLFISRPFKKNGVNLGICFFKEWTKWTDLWITKQGSLYDTNPKQGTIFGGNPPKLQETFAASLIPPPAKNSPHLHQGESRNRTVTFYCFFYVGSCINLPFWGQCSPCHFDHGVMILTSDQGIKCTKKKSTAGTYKSPI